jgi:hypothetical protein
LTQVDLLVLPYKQKIGRPSTAEHQRDEPNASTPRGDRPRLV